MFKENPAYPGRASKQFKATVLDHELITRLRHMPIVPLGRVDIVVGRSCTRSDVCVSVIWIHSGLAHIDRLSRHSDLAIAACEG